MPAPASSELRATAARVIDRVLRGASLDDVLPRARTSVAREVDASLLQALVFGVLRDYRLLEAIALGLLKRPPKRRDRLLLLLILVGLFQLRSLRVPAHAAVAETVAAVPLLGMGWARGLVNAVLRQYQRRTIDPSKLPPAVFYSHPNWLYKRLVNDWPNAETAVMGANNTRAPMTLRVNQRQCAREDYLQRFRERNLHAEKCVYSPVGLTLCQPLALSALPGFDRGEVSVQDQAAQLAQALVSPPPGARVLDACAAPGGKSAHLLEAHPDVELLALEQSRQRLPLLEQTFQRLGLDAQVLLGDAANPQQWWDGRPFDRILLDVPCSGTGVIRRHPDIKWLRRAGDIARLADRQRAMLEALWPLLGDGGRLVYATCSTLSAENEAVVAAFTAANPQACVLPVAGPWGEATPHGRRIMPGSDGMDGFFYALLERGGDGDHDGRRLAAQRPRAYSGAV